MNYSTFPDIVNGPRVDGKDVAGQTKQDLEKMVVAGGGKRFQVLPKDRECYLICDRMNCKAGSRRDAKHDAAQLG